MDSFIVVSDGPITSEERNGKSQALRRQHASEAGKSGHLRVRRGRDLRFLDTAHLELEI